MPTSGHKNSDFLKMNYLYYLKQILEKKLAKLDEKIETIQDETKKQLEKLKSTFNTNVSQRNPLNRTSEEKLKEIETIILSGGNLGNKMLQLQLIIAGGHTIPF
jgi:ferritin-like metal-binding protein YciE